MTHPADITSNHASNLPDPKEADLLLEAPFLLYQSNHLNTYTNRVIYGFTGKPQSLGGTSHTRKEIQLQRQRLCQQLNLSDTPLIIPDQIHSSYIKPSDDTDFSACDAIILTTPNQPVMIQTADCVPILLYSPDQHVGAVIHAGWRGTAQSIAAKTADRMQKDYRCVPQHMIAVIGPAITGAHYEVSPEVALALRESLPPHIPVDVYQGESPNNKPLIDLKTINAYQLKSVGIHQIDILPFCTVEHNDRFWSHRKGDTGRQALFLQLLSVKV